MEAMAPLGAVLEAAVEVTVLPLPHPSVGRSSAHTGPRSGTARALAVILIRWRPSRRIAGQALFAWLGFLPPFFGNQERATNNENEGDQHGRRER